MSQLIKVEIENNLAIIRLNRPKKFNALNLDLIKEFTDLLISLNTDDTNLGIIITGIGKAFCGGGDLKWVVDSSKSPSAALHELAGNFHQVILEIRRMNKPVIAAINGIAAGGGFSLALACDFRIISQSATFKQAYTSRGLSIDGGGTFALPRLVGMAKALEIAGFDQSISADQALSWGLVTKVVADGTVLDEARLLFSKLLKTSIHSFGWSKRLFIDSFSTSFETQLEQERMGIQMCADHSDGKNGLKAFVEKRTPIFNK